MHPLTPILVAAAALRIGVPLAALLAQRADSLLYLADSPQYTGLAGDLIRYGTFGGTQVEVFRMPGYPVMLALGALTGHMTIAALILQTALGVSAVEDHRARLRRSRDSRRQGLPARPRALHEDARGRGLVGHRQADRVAGPGPGEVTPLTAHGARKFRASGVASPCSQEVMT